MLHVGCRFARMQWLMHSRQPHVYTRRLLKGRGAACPWDGKVALQDPQAAPQKYIIPLPYSIVCVYEHVLKTGNRRHKAN